MPEETQEKPHEEHATVAEEPDDGLTEVVGKSFAPVYRAEIGAIAKRRKALRVRAGDGVLALPEVSWPKSRGPSSTLTQVFADLEDSGASWKAAEKEFGTPSGLIGVGLSGGGIRSSTFNLGVLQAIARVGLFPYVDYLSTVSGGGYIGTYLTTSIIEDKKRNEEAPDSPEDTDAPIDRFPLGHKTGETESCRFRHLRNYAKFLAPGSKSELLSIPILLLRGLVINLLFLLPFFLVAGIVFGLAMTAPPQYEYFTHVSIEKFLQNIVGFSPGSGRELMFGRFPLSSGIAVLLLLSFVGFPIVYAARRRKMLTENSLRKHRSKWLRNLRIVLIAGLIVFFVELQPVVLANSENITQWLVGFLGGASVTVPFADKIFSRLSEFQAKIGAILIGVLAIILMWLVLLFVTRQFADGSWGVVPALVVTALLAAYSFFFVDVNATSIHSFYRDHLVKAFVAQAAADDMLDASQDETPETGKEENRHSDQEEERVLKLSELDVDYTPYHLINVTVNIEPEELQFRSGRQGSFFFFAPLFCGGVRTGYVPTKDLEHIASTVDVGTAMAVSGAAVAPNMGKYSNRFVGLILALLNIRLNYWMQNPKIIKSVVREPAVKEGKEGKERWSFAEWRLRNSRVGPVYLLREMFQHLSAKSQQINLSDGGHIENLGIYELMRRQCRLIIVGDGEGDKQLSFKGLTEAIRLARIDFGYRVEMDGLDEIRSGDQQFAIGTIFYTQDRMGKLIYIKSNLGGDYNLKSTLEGDFYRSSADRDDDYLYDENAYVAHYKDENPDFPHESTADQFFDEAQFESYRALGYHVAATALIAPWVPDFETEADQ